MTLLAQLPYPASQHGLHYPQRSAGFQMAVPLIQYQRSRITFEFSRKRTSLLAHQTPLRQSLSPIGVSGFIRPLQDDAYCNHAEHLGFDLRVLLKKRFAPKAIKIIVAGFIVIAPLRRDFPIPSATLRVPHIRWSGGSPPSYTRRRLDRRWRGD